MEYKKALAKRAMKDKSERRKTMKTLIYGTILLAAISIAPYMASAGVQITIGLPPPVVFSAPPDVVVIPSGPEYVYMVPGTVGLYFYGGYWYRFYDGYWFRASHYDDPWAPIDMYLVPSPVVIIPTDYILNMPLGYHRIRYHEFHNHWSDWGRSRYWHNHRWYHNHARQHWAGQEFHRPPSSPHVQRRLHERRPTTHQPVVRSHERGPVSKRIDVMPRDRERPGKHVTYDHPYKIRKGNVEPHGKMPKGKQLDAGPIR